MSDHALFKLPQSEVARRLREQGHPIRLFGETDREVCLRLRQLELLQETDSGKVCWGSGGGVLRGSEGGVLGGVVGCGKMCCEGMVGMGCVLRGSGGMCAEGEWWDVC